VLKRVALAYDLVVAEHTPLVRPTRAERETVLDAAGGGGAGRRAGFAAGRPDGAITRHADNTPASLRHAPSWERER
jgi:hypothetical protein